MNRILLRQPGHKHNRVAREGQFTIIEPSPAVAREAMLGDAFKANILAERPCIMCLRELYKPLSKPMGKYHDSNSHAYRALARSGANLVIEGPELLLYLHDVKKLATYFLPSYAGKKALVDYRQRLAQTARDLMTLAHNVIQFTSSMPTRTQWWAPKLTATDFTWNAYRPFDEEIARFLQPANGSPVVNSLQKKFLSQRRINQSIRNMIEQANDGDYLLDEGDYFN